MMAPAPKPDLSPACDYRGAAMGRSGKTPERTAWPRRFALRRIHLDVGGYDAGGAYWGIGTPLYWAASDDGEVTLWFRARDREAAKARVAAEYPGARFYR